MHEIVSDGSPLPPPISSTFWPIPIRASSTRPDVNGANICAMSTRYLSQYRAEACHASRVLFCSSGFILVRPKLTPFSILFPEPIVSRLRCMGEDRHQIRSTSLSTKNFAIRLLIYGCGRVIDRHLVAWIRHMNRGFAHVRVAVRPFREGMRRVDLDVYNVIAFRHPGDVDPLAAKLFEIPIRPAG